MLTEKYHLFLEALGKTVHNLRVENGLTQIDLAQKANRSQSSIARVQGSPPPEISLKIFFEIADGLSINLSELIRVSEMQSNTHKPIGDKKSDSRNFWAGLQQRVDSLPRKKRDYIQQMIADLVQGVHKI